MRRPRSSTLSALILTIALTLVGATSHALYLSSMGPKECCRSHCHRSAATSDAEAGRCCATHLSVLPSALAASTPDLHTVFTAVGTAVPAMLLVTPASVPVAPPPPVLRRGAPPGTLVAVHTALLI